ncbi:MAG: flagellin [Succinivibrio sp.]
MALYLTNITGMHCTRTLSNVTSQLDTVYKRLSPGFRINSAKDDPAGLQISNRLTSQINGYKQANRNLNDGLSIAQTMEGALDETVNMLQRIRVLAVQAANGTYDDISRATITGEVEQLCQEITRIAKHTNFGGQTLLNGKEGFFLTGGIKIQASGNAGDYITIPGFEDGFSLSGLSSYLGLSSSNFITMGSEGLRFSLSTADNAQGVLGNIDKYISAVSAYQGTLGGVQNRFESAIRLNDIMGENLSDARSRIRDTDYAEEAANLAKLSIQQQICANLLPQIMQNKNIILSLLSN